MCQVPGAPEGGGEEERGPQPAPAHPHHGGRPLLHRQVGAAGEEVPPPHTREYFYHLGAYDEGMDIWGGENLELSFRWLNRA